MRWTTDDKDETGQPAPEPVEEAPTIPFAEDLGVQPELVTPPEDWPSEEDEPDLTEPSGDGYSSNTDSGDENKKAYKG